MNTDKMIDMIVKSYVTIMGEEKWNSLSDEQKHDVVMTIATDALNRIKCLLADLSAIRGERKKP